MRSDALKALYDFLATDIYTSSIHLCLASLIREDVPEFQKVTISKGVAAEFRDIVNSFSGKWLCEITTLS